MKLAQYNWLVEEVAERKWQDPTKKVKQSNQKGVERVLEPLKKYLQGQRRNEKARS